MNRVMQIIFSLLASPAAANVIAQGMAGGGNDMGGMMALQNRAKMNQMYNDGCGSEPGRLSEGIYLPQKNPIDEQMNKIRRQQECAYKKAKTRTELQEKLKRAVESALVQKDEPKKQTCISKLDRSSHECFVKSVISNFYTKPVWKVAIHDNVAELWYEGKLVLMIVNEVIHYLINSVTDDCFTFFPNSMLLTEENALGHVIKVTGKPATPKQGSSNSICRPCSDFSKDTKVIEGVASNCVASCDPANNLFAVTNFKITPSKSQKRIASSKKRESSTTRVNE